MQVKAYKRRGRPRKTQGSEASLQILFMHWLSFQHPDAFKVTFSIPNGGLRSKAEGARQVAMGLKSGIPDIFMAVPTNKFPGMFIELKWGSNKLTEKQSIAIQNLREKGYRCEVCYSLDELIYVTKDYLEDSTYDRSRSTTFTYSAPNINSDRIT